ncbi:hypothetical protein INR49_015359, partial [Caranx melampygus]
MPNDHRSNSRFFSQNVSEAVLRLRFREKDALISRSAVEGEGPRNHALRENTAALNRRGRYSTTRATHECHTQEEQAEPGRPLVQHQVLSPVQSKEECECLWQAQALLLKALLHFGVEKEAWKKRGKE